MQKLFCLAALILNLVVYSQKMDLGRVTKSELLEKRHKTDTSAVAAFIFKKAKTTYNFTEKDGFTPVTVFQVKLKVYKKEGLKWADFKIPYYIGYKNLEDEYVDIVSGFTYNLEEDKIVKSKVTGEGKFKQQLNERWEMKSVTFPNVRAGSIIELEYKFKSQNLFVLPEFQFQYNIPVDYAEFKTEIPEYFIYNAMKRGYVDLKIDQKIEPAVRSYEEKVDKATVSRNVSYRQITTHYSVSDIPGLKEESFVNNIDNYYGKIEHELQTIRYPDKEPKKIASSWEDLAKSIYQEKEFSKAVSDYDYFLSDIKYQTKDLSALEDRLQKVFNYLKNRMNWNGEYGYYPKRELALAYKEKTGSVAEINLMLVAMLRIAGLEANPVLISTRDNGLAYFPNHSLFNYVIVCVNHDNKAILLDATDKNSSPNILPIRTLNDVGRKIKINGQTEEVDLMPKFNSEDIVNIMASINADADVNGKIRESYFNYHALLYKERHGKLTPESYVDKLQSRYKNLEITDYTSQNKDDLSKPIIESYAFNSTDLVETIGNKMYFSPMLYLTQTQNPFRQEKREYPVDFMFPQKYKLNVTIAIPDGYEVDTMPESKAVSLPENIGDFKYVISSNGNKIQLLFTFDINQAVILPDYYEALKNFYKEMINKQTEKVVLKKV